MKSDTLHKSKKEAETLKQPLVFIDGKFYPKSEAKVSVFDHGLLYGDGVFEGIRSYNCLVFKLKEHLVRLYESAHTLLLNIPLTKEASAKAIIETLRVNHLRDSYVRVIVTRGTGDLGLDPRKCKKPTIIIIADKIVLYPESLYKNGMDIITVPTVRNLPEAVNPSIKSLNYLNNILAKIEAVNSGYQEALMLNADGYVVECTGDNIFIVKNGILQTPPTYLGALKGITRQAIMDLAVRNDIPRQEQVLTRHDLFNADEAFLTGTAAEVIPVVKIDGRVIGDGKPGKMTQKLMSAFRDSTKKDGVKYTV
ncbi:MAG: branched-chain-amino-acid transaminase [Omnitrophica bacterium RIFCSPLOWO2_12_FULL_44_17]|uniref:Branched-chain-amino-acid aminotransferase n=1 Tax=Candidatus Danuiimicrobium aquiferis TaxID=1801832 RepID=A0A1G1L050_9BACT|nr:MAG: branched-chain-amino-acid transaminase [Omnitrophica bacterium RIFCSPHIGHO2_02_FULL_45_28]OGW91607.1 MAG: branched-chain-amino-acid transaminase [Omnitrophica bacterium RIFCSPHIGHO2_12_FULL_44_12]OGW98520.1 MAG: branched-chain-amino-acid transaminase [Omnitrophica bacterium RIFCSPLOWO2_12_FULL_44_17]OGX05072.1 MAG: branched-chain-amino-acid transaminase [Omnitrophica bacterium RIFCSPLOWO2_02_FULL_44_11]